MTSHHENLNSRAQAGFSNSQAYDLHRPSYSPTVVQLLLEQLRVAGKHGARVVDLAAGGGKFTEALAGRDERFDIVAVEPHDSMRAVLAAKGLAGVTVSPGVADNIALKDESVDAVIVAQAFHWFANMAALKEIHRVLQPHGTIGLVWNIDDYNAPLAFKPKVAWEAKAQELIREIEDLTGDCEPRFRHAKWRAIFDEQLKKTPLSLIQADDQYFSLPIGEHVEPYEVALPADKLWDRFRTIGHIAVLEGEQKDRIYRAFMDAVNTPDTPRDEQGHVILHGNTYVYWSSKIPSDGRESLVEVERPMKDRA